MSADSRDHRSDDGSFIDWTREAWFNFDSEVDALKTLTELGDELRAAREQVRQVTRYLHAAIHAAERTYEIGDEEPVSRRAIAGHCGLAVQTVCDVLDGKKATILPVR